MRRSINARNTGRLWSMTAVVMLACGAAAFAQAPGQDNLPPPGLRAPADTGETPLRLREFDPATGRSPELTQKEQALVQSIEGPEIPLVLNAGLGHIMRTRAAISRIAIANPEICEVVQYSPTEIELIGRTFGTTSMTIWFGEQEPRPTLRYLIQIGPGQSRQYRQSLRERYWDEMERRISALFPSSSIQLVPVMDKLLVRGQAKDPQEAQRIMQFLRVGGGPTPGQANTGDLGTSIDPSEGDAPIGTSQLIDMLEVPGETNVMLKVRIASVNRSALRQFGFTTSVNQPKFSFSASYGAQPNVSAIFDGGALPLLFEAFENNGTVKILAEPNLVTISGSSASFIAGGAFPVPTVVGLGGVGAAGTSFRGIGTQLSFQPVVIDRDRIRLTVSTSFSTVNAALTVAGVPGTDNRAVQTVVDLREGQWLAVAGLLQEEQAGGKSRLPFVGNLPVVEMFFSTKNVTRDENEVVILVSPELVRPLDPENIPLLLPGTDVTEPDDYAFYVQGRYEGRQGVYHRSTVWQEYKHRMRDAMRDARCSTQYHSVCNHYQCGDHGFSR